MTLERERREREREERERRERETERDRETERERKVGRNGEGKRHLSKVSVRFSCDMTIINKNYMI